MRYPPVAVQLISLPDEIARDLPGTLAALADMGYRGVELPPDFPWEDAPRYAEALRRAGLACAGYWVGLPDMREPGSGPYAAARILRPHYWATCVWCGDLARDWRACLERLRWSATVASRAGQLVVYHGHAWDWGPVDAEHPNALDMLFDELPADVVQAMFDTYYVRRGGAEPVDHLRRYAGRIPAVHAKEIVDPDGAQTHAPVGDGAVDWPGVFAAARDGGTAWITIDHDAKTQRGLDVARRSIAHLRSKGLA